MRKILFTLTIAIISFNTIEAQVTTGGFRRGGTKHQIKAMQREKLKDSLKLTDAQSKNVDALQQMYMLRMRAVNLDTKLTKEERRVQIEAIQAERKEKLRAVLSEEQLAKMDNELPKVKKENSHKKYSSGKKKKKTSTTKKRQS